MTKIDYYNFLDEADYLMKKIQRRTKGAYRRSIFKFFKRNGRKIQS